MQCGKDGAKSHVDQTGGGGLVSVVLLLCVEFMYRFIRWFHDRLLGSHRLIGWNWQKVSTAIESDGANPRNYRGVAVVLNVWRFLMTMQNYWIIYICTLSALVVVSLTVEWQTHADILNFATICTSR